jgi:hypothetical protein
MRVETHYPQHMKIDFLPPELSKTGQITPWSSFKKIIVNHRKIIK